MLRTIVKVIVGGNDVTSNFAPALLKVKVTKKEKSSSDTASITLADKDGQIFMPTSGAEIVVMLGHTIGDVGEVFRGTVNDVTSKGAAGSGRTLEINAKSADQTSNVKQQQSGHKDNATLETVAKEWGKKAGLDVTVIGDIAKEEREYWSINRESFQSWGQRIAQDLGASFRIIGKRAFIAPMNDGKSVSGKSLTPIYAAAGTNLINWSLSPEIARPQYGKITTTRYDRKSGEWKTTTENVENATSKAVLGVLHSSPNEKRSKSTAKGKAKKSEREKGGGTVNILGDHAAEPGANCIVSGARPGIDNTYIIDAVEHDVDNDGWQSELTLKLPSAKGGKDTRTSSSKASSNAKSTAGSQGAAINADRFATP